MKGRSWVLFIILFLLSLVPASAFAQALDKEVGSVAARLAEDLIRAKVKSIATTDFINYRNRPNMLGRYIADTLTTELFSKSSHDAKKPFEIVERARLEAILRELNLSAAGLVNPDNARRVGNVAGVDALIVGNLVDMGENISVTVRAISTDTAKVLSAHRFSFLPNAAQRKLLQIILPSSGAGNGDGVVPPPIADEDEGEGMKTAFFIAKPVGATFQDGSLTASMEVKNYKDYPIFIGFLGDYNGNRIKSSVITDSGAACSPEEVTPLPFYRDVYFTIDRSRNPVERLSMINPGSSTILSVKFECKGDIGKRVISFDIGLHIAYNPSSKKGDNLRCKKRDCKVVVTKTSIAVKNIPIKKSQ